MYEKILEKLKAQRGTTSNVSDRSLEDLAKSLETIVTTDEILEVADLTNAIKSIDGNINYYTAEQVKAIEKKSQEEAAKKVKEEIEAKAKKAGEEMKKNEDVPQYVKDLLEQNKTITETLAGLKGEKIAKTREEKMSEILKEAPGYYKDQVIESFKNTSFENDDSFTAYLEKSKTNFDSFKQQAKEQGLNTFAPKTETKKEEKEQLNPVFEQAMKAHDEMNKNE